MNETYDPGMHNNEMSEYGSLLTNFAWIGKISAPNSSSIDEISSTVKYKNLFRKDSILDVTQNLLDESDDTSDVAKLAIDQTKRKFDDGYKIISRGNGVFGGVLDTNDGKHVYKVPKRNKRDEMKDAELCRVWTKEKPYSKVGHAVRYKELIRKERNSVVDRFGNYNIFPTQLNVNEGYGRPGSGVGDATVEAFGEKRARKYMLSIENLAWRDSSEFNELPACEKGSNGGRVMWFPPYDVKFNDDSTANWTTHNFLGRPEPIYTYNNTERSGTLSFKIVVDHPSILNTLVKYEMAGLSDGDVDEILASFWAGCVEYDVFELARIYGVLSDTDISFFKDVIADIEPKLKNEKAQEKVNAVTNRKSDTIVSKPLPVSDIKYGYPKSSVRV